MTMLTPSDPSTAGALTVRGGSQDGMVVALCDPVTRLGRGLQADLIVEDPTVSRRHAIIVRREGEIVLLDDNSLNGTWCNGVRVTDRVVLRDGDTIALGAATLRFAA